MTSKHAILPLMLCLMGCGTSGDLPEMTPQALTILSYNIRHGEGTDGHIDLDRIARVIGEQKPDLVALQEVDCHCRRSGALDMAEELGQKLNMQSKFGSFMDYQGGQYGMAVLSRWPIIESVVHRLPSGAEPRVALEVVIGLRSRGQFLSFICIHNDWTKEEFRVKQVTSLLDALKNRDRAIVLAGDFNGERTDKSLQILRNQGWTMPQNKGAFTFPSGNPTTEIDFFMTKNMSYETLEYDVIEEKVASDHRPIKALLKVIPCEHR